LVCGFFWAGYIFSIFCVFLLREAYVLPVRLQKRNSSAILPKQTSPKWRCEVGPPPTNRQILGQFNRGFIITRLRNDIFIIDQVFIVVVKLCMEFEIGSLLCKPLNLYLWYHDQSICCILPTDGQHATDEKYNFERLQATSTLHSQVRKFAFHGVSSSDIFF
jgi:hypothetical protein